jgi:hypothetical protein
MHRKSWLESLKGKDHSKNLGLDGRIILKWEGRVLTGFIWLRMVSVTGSCKHSDESSGSIKCWECFDQLSNYDY